MIRRAAVASLFAALLGAQDTKIIVLLPLEEDRPPSMLPVHAGVSIMVMGQFSDWATSWRQPEGNPLLVERSGPYIGLLYRTGTYRKAGIAGAGVAVSYLIAWRWPQSRKYVGWFSALAGGVSFGVAVSNTVRNPWFR